MLAPSDSFEDVPQTLKDDVSHFCDEVKDELPNQDFFKSAVAKHYRRADVGATENQLFVK